MIQDNGPKTAFFRQGKKIGAMVGSLLLLAMPAGYFANAHFVQDPEGYGDIKNMGEKSSIVAEVKLAEVLAHSRRDTDRARDEWRHPLETLRFMDVRPNHHIIEYSPGGGWYTRVLLPYVEEEGKYTAINWRGGYGNVPERFAQRVVGWDKKFADGAAEYTGVPAEKIDAYFANALPAEMAGTVDRVLIVRMLHNLYRWDIALIDMKALHHVLKDDGMIGIVQHSAGERSDMPKALSQSGYMTRETVIELMEEAGFTLADSSDINKNPKDMADHPNGVWTLPPVLAAPDEEKEKYKAIGESNRMTLLFKKSS